MEIASSKKTLALIFLVLLLAFLAAFLAGWWVRGNSVFQNKKTIVEKIIPKPFEVYSLESLAKSPYPAGMLKIKDPTANENFDSYTLDFTFSPKPDGKDVKTTTGVVNVPKNKTGKLPLVLMIRGYVDPEIYKPGVGTNKAAQVFTKNGYITVAPDFLGYSQSDINSANIFESRFQTYTTVLSLLNSLDQINDWDKKNIFIWAHSNGGQIALTTLEVTGKNIPTTLWAPVFKPFPYSILYYTDESQDKGKLIRRELSKFEDLYDSDKYSLDEYLENITAPLQIHQGTADDAVPVDWSRSLSKKLKTMEKEVTYFEYSGSDHNLQPAWNTAVERDLAFFQKYLL